MQDNLRAIHVFFGGATSRRCSPGSWCATGAVWRLWCLILMGVALSVTSVQAQPFVAYVTSYGSHDVSVIDTSTNTVTDTIPVEGDPFGVAVSPNGAFVYVTNLSSNDVWVIATSTNTVTTRIPVEGGPLGVAVTPNGAFVYVANADSDTVSVIATSTNTVTTTIPVGDSPWGIAVSPNGAFVYVANAGSDQVSVIATSTNTVTTTIPVEDFPLGVAVSPNGAFVYVANNFSHTVSVIATSTNTVTTTIPVGNGPYGVAITPDGAFVYVAGSQSDTVSVIDTATNTEIDVDGNPANGITRIPVGGLPLGIAVTPDGAFVYVANNIGVGSTVSVIATASNTVTTTIPVGSSPAAFGQFIGPEPTAAAADLSLTKADSPDPVLTGKNLTYTLTVSNAGPSAVGDAVLNDPLPANTTFQSLTAPAGWSCTTPAVGSPGTVNCGPASLAAGATASFTLVVKVAGAAGGTTLSNTATVSSDEFDPTDPNMGNNSDTETTTVTKASQALKLTVQVKGKGSVTSSPPGINTCTASCSATYNSGTQVTLTATAAPGSVFTGWNGGGCQGTGTCVVTVTADTKVTATFTKQ